MGPAAQKADLYRQLVWATLGRLIVALALLGATAMVAFSEEGSLMDPLLQGLYWLAGGVFIASLGYAAALRRLPGGRLPGLAYAQIMGDVALAAVLVWLTGGRESVFIFLFSLSVVLGAIFLQRRGAMAGAVLSALAYAALVVGMQWDLIPPAATYLDPDPLPPARLIFNLSIHAAALFLIGWLASHLTEQLQRTGERLSASQRDYRALAALHRRIMASVSSGLLTLDGHARVTFVNRAGGEMLAAQLEGAVGRTIDQVLPSLAEALAELRPGAVLPRGEVEVEGPEGRRVLGFTVSPLTDAPEGVGEWVVVFQDLTSLRRLEQALRTQERLASLGGLAAGLAHELRNPLASMSGSVELLQASLPEDAEARQLLAILLREAERLNDLVTDFLQFARPAPPRRALVPVRELVEGATAALRHDPALAETRLEVAPASDVTLSCDRDQLHQVLLNLLLNAGQAAGPGGRVRVEVEACGDTACLSVGDDGPGLTEEALQRVFDPFYTTKPRGTGLGLAVVERIVEAHGGRVEVDSALGVGTRFTVHLPIEPELPGASEPSDLFPTGTA